VPIPNCPLVEPPVELKVAEPNPPGAVLDLALLRIPALYTLA
jgi:hypothetical protein